MGLLKIEEKRRIPLNLKLLKRDVEILDAVSTGFILRLWLSGWLGSTGFLRGVCGVIVRED